MTDPIGRGEAEAAAREEAPEQEAPEQGAPEQSAPEQEAPEQEAREAAAVDEMETLRAERDEYLDHLRRVQAEFENYRKRIARQQVDAIEQAAGRLVESLLPVLDACDAAMRHGSKEVEPIFASLLGTLEKEGLARLDPSGEPFDPTAHEAVMHDTAEGAEDADAGPVVSDVLRPGYTWKGKVIRPAMVKVRG